jgi:hypothetical protein
VSTSADWQLELKDIPPLKVQGKEEESGVEEEVKL